MSYRIYKGFTLVELMIVVAVVAILAAIAYPSYRENIRRGNRSAVQSLMMEMVSREEQYMLDKKRYGTTAEIYGVSSYSLPPEILGKYTVVAVPEGPPPSYTITATPVAGSIQANDATLTIDDRGYKTPADKWK